MPAVTNPIHEVLPDDDATYKVIWAGEIVLPAAESATRRFRLWLSPVDAVGAPIAGQPAVQITESAGAIPRFAIGSYWRKRKQVRTEMSRQAEAVYLDLAVPPLWEADRVFVQSGGKSAGRQNWIDKQDFPLLLQTTNQRSVPGYKAWVVPARTTDGREVILPCYEIFRAFYAGTSDLAHELLKRRWTAANARFVRGSNSSIENQKKVWHLDLAPNVPHSAVPYLSWLTFAPAAAAAADQISVSLVSQSAAKEPTWVRAIPPIAGVDKVRIKAYVQELPRQQARLVTQILAFQISESVGALSYSTPVQRIAIPPEDSKGTKVKEVAKSVSKDPPSVAPPADRRETVRYVTLPSASVKWGGLPLPKRKALETRYTPGHPIKTTLTETAFGPVSVGAKGGGKQHRAAQFTPEEEQAIESNFELIYNLISELRADGVLEDAIEYPLVRPAPSEAPTYCQFPHLDQYGKKLSWAWIKSPFPRVRLALVLQLTFQGRFIYWIETEDPAHRGFCSLAVEMTSDASLDEGQLESLLDTCAYANGVWPNKTEIGEGEFFAEKVVHKMIDGSLRPSVMLGAFERLRRRRNNYRTSVANQLEALAP